jgi:hypothetical protein
MRDDCWDEDISAIDSDFRFCHELATQCAYRVLAQMLGGNMLIRRLGLIAFAMLHCFLPMSASNSAIAAETEPCDTFSLRTAEDGVSKFRYAKRVPGLYCDGIAAAKHSGQLALIAVTANDDRDMNRCVVDGILHLRTPNVVGMGDVASVRIKGVEIEGENSYRLDGRMEKSELRVDLAPVITPLHLPIADLGFVAFGVIDQKTRYLPVSCANTKEPLKSVTLTLRYPEGLRQVTSAVSFIPLARGTDQKAERVGTINLEDIKAKCPFHLSAKAGSRAGWLVFSIEAKAYLKEDSPTPREYQVFISGQ